VSPLNNSKANWDKREMHAFKSNTMNSYEGNWDKREKCIKKKIKE
jgi:hypothetical protein